MRKKEQNLESPTLFDNGKGNKKVPIRKPDAVKLLERMVFDEERKKYTTFPIDYFDPIKFNDNTVNELTKCIIAFIKLNGGSAVRIIITTGRLIKWQETFTDIAGRSHNIGRIEWIHDTISNGIVIATINGRSVKIEVQIGRNRMNQPQKDYKLAVESAGWVYYLAKDFTSFFYWFNFIFRS